MIEIDYDWGEPPPRIKKRFGKKSKGKKKDSPDGKPEKQEKKNPKEASKAQKRAEKAKLLEKWKKYDPRAAIKKANQKEQDDDSLNFLEEKSVKLEELKNGNDQTEQSDIFSDHAPKKNND